MQGLCTRSNEQGSFAVKIQNTQLKKKKNGGELNGWVEEEERLSFVIF